MTQESAVHETAVDTHNELSISLTRIFDAPPALVYRAWTDPEMMAQWWGPMPTRSTATMDVRLGGAYSLIMHAENGTDYPVHGTFTEVLEDNCLEMAMEIGGHPDSWFEQLTDAYHSAGGPDNTVPSLHVVTRVTFEPYAGNRTRQVVTQTYRTQADRDAFVKMGSAQGWSMSLDKLDRVLA